MSTTKVTDALRTVTEVDAAKITTGTIPEARITSLDSTKLTGTVADARLPATALNSNVDLTTLSASNLTTGTVTDARLPATALNSNVDLTTLSASNLTTGTIDNARISLDATKIPSLDAAKITTGTIAEARLGTLDATKLTGTIDVGRLSNAPATDLTPVHQGIATLALHMGVADNKVAFNLPNSFIDVFQDDSGITTETNVDRNAAEYISSVSSSTGLGSAVDMTSANFWAGNNGGNMTGWSWSTNSVSGVGSAVNEQGGTTDGSSTPVVFEASKPFEYYFTPHMSPYPSGANGYGGMVGIVPTSYLGNNDNSSASTALFSRTGYLMLTAGTHNGYRGLNYVQTSSRAQINSNQYNGVACIFKRNASNYLEFWAAGSLVYTSVATHSDAYEIIISGQGAHLSGMDNQSYKKTVSVNVASATGTLVSTVQTAPVATTTLSGAILYTDNAGTNTLGTGGTHNLGIWLTANLQGTSPNWTGTNWYDVGDTENGGGGYGTAQTFSGSIKQVKLGKTTVTSGTQVAMKAVWANQAAAASGTSGLLDQSGTSKTVTNNGVTQSTTQKLGWGTHSLYFNGSSNFSVTAHADFDFASADATIEFWYYSTTSSSDRIIGRGSHPGEWFYRSKFADDAEDFKSYINGSNQSSSDTGRHGALNTWTHAAIVRDGSNIRVYTGGIQRWSTAVSGSWTVTATSNAIGIGRGVDAGTGEWFTGYLQDIRISNTARYPSGTTFSVPTAAFVTDSNTKLLITGSDVAGVAGKIAHLEGWAVNY